MNGHQGENCAHVKLPMSWPLSFFAVKQRCGTYIRQTSSVECYVLNESPRLATLRWCGNIFGFRWVDLVRDSTISDSDVASALSAFDLWRERGLRPVSYASVQISWSRSSLDG